MVTPTLGTHVPNCGPWHSCQGSVVSLFKNKILHFNEK